MADYLTRETGITTRVFNDSNAAAWGEYKKGTGKTIVKTTLVVMAAGIGSRFGVGIKQLAPVDARGHIIMDYYIYDAKEAGFDKVVFVIRKDIEEEFKRVIGNRMTGIEVE